MLVTRVVPVSDEIQKAYDALNTNKANLWEQYSSASKKVIEFVKAISPKNFEDELYMSTSSFETSKVADGYLIFHGYLKDKK